MPKLFNNTNGQLRVYEKDAVGMPMPAPGPLYGEGIGPWSLVPGEVISEVVTGGSPLLRWIPSRPTIARNEHVKHLSWIAPEGFDGSGTYMDYLAGLAPIGECEFGPSTEWNGFEYRHEMYRVTFKSETLTRRNFGLKEYENQPIVRLRGPNADMPVQNDGEWALARVGMQLATHLDWNIIYGDPAFGPLMYHGLESIISKGWVASRAIGPGQVTNADPIIFSAVGLSDNRDIIKLIRAAVRRIRMRAMAIGYRLTSNDYAVVMSGAHWASMADTLAIFGSMEISEGISLGTTVADVQRQRREVTTGGVGFGTIDVDGSPVTVIIEDQLAANVTLPGGGSGVTGDIYILTRSVNGTTILENQYLDWNRLPVPLQLDNEFIRQNGMIRAGYVVEANSCFYYYVDMWGRLMSRYQPLQARIKDVTVATLLDNENESSAFTSPNFKHYDGRRGGEGVAYLTPIA